MRIYPLTFLSTTSFVLRCRLHIHYLLLRRIQKMELKYTDGAEEITGKGPVALFNVTRLAKI